MNTFLIVDDHAVVRAGMRLLLSDEFANCTVFEAKDELEVKDVLMKHPVNMMILDLKLEDGNDPVNIINYSRGVQPGIKIVILSMEKAEIYARRFFRIGINGFISKGADEYDIAYAIRTVLKGKFYISDDLNNFLSKTLSGEETPSIFDSLSTREYQVVRELVAGKSLTDISELLSISLSTVSTHKAKVFEKLGIKGSNILALLKLAKEHNIA